MSCVIDRRGQLQVRHQNLSGKVREEMTGSSRVLFVRLLFGSWYCTVFAACSRCTKGAMFVPSAAILCSEVFRYQPFVAACV